ANLQASTDAYTGAYNPGDMTNGTPPVEPSFTRTVNVYDSQGGSQPVTIDWLKTGANTWSYEVSYAGDAANNLTGGNALLASGEMSFNSDGTLANADDSQSTPTGSVNVTIPWGGSSGLSSQTLALNFGTPGASNGLTQFDSASTLTNSTIDGALFGTLSGVSVGADGLVTAQFSNGLTQKIAQVPLATFTNANGLSAISGNAYAQTQQSGNAVIGAAGAGGAGKIQSAALEGSTVDLATEFTNLITTQRAYSASTRVITTASEMLDTLNNMH
ncbi:MAG TPA: flagellar hook-basal body complex protein, partial [Rhizomicrobium sp.]